MAPRSARRFRPNDWNAGTSASESGSFPWDRALQDRFNDFFSAADTILLGRKMAADYLAASWSAPIP